MLGGILSAVAGPIIGGLFGLSGSKAQASSASASNAAQLAFSRSEAVRNQENFNRNFSQQQSFFDTTNVRQDAAHQREMADLSAAGLNPILTATGGSGAPTGGGGSASSSGVVGLSQMQMPNPVQDAINSALATARLQADVNLIKEQTKTQQTQQFANDQQSYLAGQKALESEAQTQSIKQLTEKLKEDTAVSSTNAKLLQTELPGRKIEEDIDSGIGGTISRWLNRFLPTFRGLSSAVGVARAPRGRRP